MKKVAGKLKIELAQFKELEEFSQFGSDLDATTKEILNHGNKITNLLIQEESQPRSLSNQVISLYVFINKFVDDLETSKLKEFTKKLLKYIHNHSPEVINYIEENKDINDEIISKIVTAVQEVKRNFNNAK